MQGLRGGGVLGSSSSPSGSLDSADPRAIERIAVRVDIEHRTRGDLRIELVAPDDRARLLTRELVSGSDLILAMGPHHLERIEALGGTGKAHLLSSYASKGRSDRSITDPFGGDLDVYRSAFDELDREVQHAIERIAAERAPGRS